MWIRNIDFILPFYAEKKKWFSSFLFFIIFILVSQISSLSSPSYIWDDLDWYWTYSIDGSDALFSLLTQVGHPTFWPFIEFAYRMFGDHATFPTTIIALVFHVVNSILVMHLMRHLNAGRVASFLAFVFYLASPYYFNRGTVCHYFYDIFMSFFLFSIYFSEPDKSKFKRFILAPLFQFLYFGLPTLVMLEPLRLAIHWELKKHDYKQTIISLVPYWVIALIFAVTAFVVFKPSGYYEGYNEMKLDIAHLFFSTLDYFIYIPKALFFHVGNTLAVLKQLDDWPFFLLLVAVSFFMMRMMPLPKKNSFIKNAIPLLFLGGVLILFGAAPYILAGRSPSPQDFNSRLFFISGLGFIIMVSVSLAMIRSDINRKWLTSVVLGVFLISGFQQAKAYMYDHIVRQSVLHGLQSGRDSMINIQDQDLFVILISDPLIKELFTQRRLPTHMEFSVPMNIKKSSGNGKWYIYNYDDRGFSPPDYFNPPLDCSLAAHDRHPCPPNYLVAKFQLDKNKALANFGFLELLYQSFWKERPALIGRVEFLTPPKPYNMEAMTVRWYRKLAEEGVSGAQNSLGLMYLEGFGGLPQDDAQAMAWFRKSTAQGILDARVNVGMMYLEGRGVEKDEEFALQFFRSAAEYEYARAQYNLGILYEQGRVVPQSYAEAFKWYLKAAEQDYTLAQVWVGEMYARGLGTMRDDRKAVNWLRKAAKKHDKVALYTLGIMLIDGRGSTKDAEAAAAFLKESASQGYPRALFSLGYLYEHGIGVPKDSRESYFWYRLACLYGESQARTTAEKISSSLGQLLAFTDKKALDERVSKWRPVEHKKPPMWH